jgi:phospholipase C
MSKILPQIQNIIVVMFENRSLDNLCGWLYSDSSPQPSQYLPAGSPAAYNGLNPNLWNPSNDSYFKGDPPKKVPVQQGAANYQVPDPDPEETFVHVTSQLYGPQGENPTPKWPTQGFIVDYKTVDTPPANPDLIMETYTPSQVPLLSALAQNYAISDAWFCSVPSQTLPNRAFVHAGTSNGKVDNGDFPDPFDFDVPSIFNVLHSRGVSWKVYSDTILTPSLTRTFFPQLWDPIFEDHFQHFGAFEDDCARNALPEYSFIEPSFLFEPNDQHPPHDVSAGEQFLYRIWKAVSESPAWNHTLLVITYDEHGGCYDHVLPPTGAATPDVASDPGENGFRFDRFGVRVPTVVVSPYVQAGTVFRSNTSTPYDHTSLLATLRDWLEIPPADMLASQRIDKAPNLEQVLTLASPRAVTPQFPPPRPAVPTSLTLRTNSLQKSLLSGAAHRFGLHPKLLLDKIPTRQHAVEFFKRRVSRAHK